MIFKMKLSSLLKLVVIVIVSDLMCVKSSTRNSEEVPSFSPEAALIFENEELPLCSRESCQELRERVESLEGAVRAIISALSDEKNRHFVAVSQKIGKNRAVRSVPSPSTASEDDSKKQENLQTTTESSKSRQNQTKAPASINLSVHQLKHSVKCSLSHMLDIHVSASQVEADGILNATLHRTSAEKAIEIFWSPPSARCIEFITGLWVRVYETNTDGTTSAEPYLSIPRKCLKSSHEPSGREALSIILPTSNSSAVIESSAECNFTIIYLIDCRSYHVEVVPDYHSLRGRSTHAEIIIPPTMDSLTRLESLMSVSALFDSLALNWEDNSGCASRLTSVNLRLWPDGLLPSKKKDDQVNNIEPISYSIPRSCLKQVPRDGNLFSVTLSSDKNHSSCARVPWRPLDKCRKYVLEMQSQYSSAWNGPTSYQTIFTSITQDSTRYPSSPYLMNDKTDLQWRQCIEIGQILCSNQHYHHSYRRDCLSYDYVCNGEIDCHNSIFGNRYSDEQYCEDRHTCHSGFKCGRQCIPKDKLCDGNYDCLNREDETMEHCDYLNSCQYLTSASGTFALSEPNPQLPLFVKRTTLLISVKPDQVIMVDFAKLDRNKTTKVKLYDGPYSTSPVLLSYDSVEKSQSVRSTGPNLYVEYYSYENQTAGVKASYTTIKKIDDQPFIQGCGGYVNALNGDSIISQPNWHEYADLLDRDEAATSVRYRPDQCIWFIEARHSGETILLKREKNNRPQLLLHDDDRQANNNSIIVYDGWTNESSVVVYNGTSESKETIYSSSSKMLVRFHRPINEIQSRAMLMENWIVTTTFTPQCKEHLTETSGTVSSPNYPAPYSKSYDCRWTISARPGSVIRILFAFFQTKENRDFVNVYDGETVYHPLLMEKSGTVFTPFVVNSSSNQVLVRFTSSEEGIDSINGFLAVYSVV